MNLSPLTRAGLRLTALLASERGEPVEELNSSKEAIEVIRWQCPDCGGEYEYEEEAVTCCDPNPGNPEEGSVACPVCARAYGEHREAVDCCLWKDLDAPTRWRIADAVEAGSTWADQLEMHA